MGIRYANSVYVAEIGFGVKLFYIITNYLISSVILLIYLKLEVYQYLIIIILAIYVIEIFVLSLLSKIFQNINIQNYALVALVLYVILVILTMWFFTEISSIF